MTFRLVWWSRWLCVFVSVQRTFKIIWTPSCFAQGEMVRARLKPNAFLWPRESYSTFTTPVSPVPWRRPPYQSVDNRRGICWPPWRLVVSLGMRVITEGKRKQTSLYSSSRIHLDHQRVGGAGFTCNWQLCLPVWREIPRLPGSVGRTDASLTSHLLLRVDENSEPSVCAEGAVVSV